MSSGTTHRSYCMRPKWSPCVFDDQCELDSGIVIFVWVFWVFWGSSRGSEVVCEFVLRTQRVWVRISVLTCISEVVLNWHLPLANSMRSAQSETWNSSTLPPSLWAFPIEVICSGLSKYAESPLNKIIAIQILNGLGELYRALLTCNLSWVVYISHVRQTFFIEGLVLVWDVSH